LHLPATESKSEEIDGLHQRARLNDQDVFEIDAVAAIPSHRRGPRTIALGQFVARRYVAAIGIGS
jgi:hypothetical protein